MPRTAPRAGISNSLPPAITLLLPNPPTLATALLHQAPRKGTVRRHQGSGVSLKVLPRLGSTEVPDTVRLPQDSIPLTNRVITSRVVTSRAVTNSHPRLSSRHLGDSILANIMDIEVA